MEKKKRWVFIATFCISAIAVGFLSASLGTDYWVEAFPIRNVNNDTVEGARNVTDDNLDTKFRGYVNFGLFHGYKALDYGLGRREGKIWIECRPKDNACGWAWDSYTDLEASRVLSAAVQAFHIASKNNVDEMASQHGLFNFGLWVSTIVFTALAIAWGLVCMGFAALNAGTRPIETITGPMGLYLWNILGVVFSLLSVVLYVVLFFQDLKHNVLTVEDQKYLWTSEGQAHLHFSFYFVLVSVVLFALNILVIALSGIHCRPIRYGNSMNEKALDGVMMY